MQEQPNTIRIKRKTILYFAVVLITLVGVTPVLADYLGPDRTKTETVSIGVDNFAPIISLPDAWFQWDTVSLDVWDKESGLSEVYVEIIDPKGRWPNRVIQLDPKQFPLSFKWDRRFGDYTIAKTGTYDVKIVAFDNVGNKADIDARICILIGALPSGPIATRYPT